MQKPGTAATAAPTITITPPVNVAPSTAFVMSGTLTGYTKAPTLTYVDNPVVAAVTGVKASVTGDTVSLSWNADAPLAWKALPTGAIVTTTTFSFTHPALAAGSYMIDVTDGTYKGAASYTVAASTITHETVIAELEALQTTINQIIINVGSLTP